MLLGRRKIFTNENEINKDNIVSVLRKAYAVHTANAAEIQYLIDFERGVQPLAREKKIRSDINIVVQDNIANYVKKFNIGYFWSSPIMLVQRGNKEMHNANADTDSSGITALNEMLKNGENIGYKDQCMAEFFEVGGIGHRLIDVKTDFDDDTLFWSEAGEFVGSLVNVYTLDSRYAFCVYHNGVGQKKLMGVTFVKSGGKLKFTCFTDKERFEISGWDVKDVQKNPLGKVPIVEYERSFDRMGCFERSISEMDSLNIMVSDFTNDVAQHTQEIWWGNDLDFPEDANGNPKAPKSGQWVLTSSGAEKNPKIQPLSSTADNQSTLSAINKQRSWILQKCNVPLQYDSSGGGSTGVAMDISSGWSDAEVAATQKQQMVDKAKREELNLILKAISLVPAGVLPLDSPIRKVHSTDVEFKHVRKKNLDIATRANAYATLVAHGINGRHAMIMTELSPDIEQVWIDSKDGIEAFQKSAYENSAKEGAQSGEEQSPDSDRIMQDLSDQTTNSPILSGQ